MSRYPLGRILVLLALLGTSAACFAAPASAEGLTWAAVGKVLLILLPVLAIFVGAFFYLRHLHDIFYRSCNERFQLDLFAKSPLGLPEGTIGAMLRLIAGVLLIYFVVVVIIDINVSGLPSLDALIKTNGQVTDQGIKNLMGGVFAILFLVLVIVGAVFYMQSLQKRFFNGCVQSNQLQKFFEAPAGLPEGTIRSVLALLIVVISLFFIIFQFYINNSDKVPEGLLTLLTAVVSFYFANRATAQGTTEAAAKQTQGLRDQRDAAVKEQQKTQADTIVSKVNKALQVTDAASKLLPEKQRKQYEALSAKLKTGLSTAEGLLQRDNPAEAATLITGALGEFGRSNPIFQAVAKALPSFTRVLGVGVPALGLITAVVTIGVRIGTSRYQAWKLRILQAPIAAATLPIQTIDGLMAERLFHANAILERAFSTELASGASANLATAAMDFVNLDSASLWKKYRLDGNKERFDSQDEFERTVQAFRRLLRDNELRPYVEAAWAGPMNNYDALVSAVDKLHEDEEARARLDELIITTDGLMSEGQPVLQIMEKVEEEIKHDGTAKS